MRGNGDSNGGGRVAGGGGDEEVVDLQRVVGRGRMGRDGKRGREQVDVATADGVVRTGGGRNGRRITRQLRTGHGGGRFWVMIQRGRT